MVAVLNTYPQQVVTVVQTGHYGGVTSECSSRDGKFIATGSADKTMIEEDIHQVPLPVQVFKQFLKRRTIPQ